MRRTSVRASLALRILAWSASAVLHVGAAWLGVLAWPVILLLFWLGGIPADDRYAFRWDNPYYRGSSGSTESGEGAVVVVLPRPPRELPEMVEPPRDLEWDSRRLAFDERLGRPAPHETPFLGASDSNHPKITGDSLDFVSDKPFRGKGTYDVLGANGGGGGRYGSKVVLKDAVQVGLLWLARHQAEDGSWSAAALADRCGRALPNGRTVAGPVCASEADADDVVRWTALATIAFAGAKYYPDSPDAWDGIRYREVVARACRFLSRAPKNAQARALALLAWSAVHRPLSRFERAPREPEPTGDGWEELLAVVEADPPPAEGSQEAAWRAMALVRSKGSGLGVSSALVGGAKRELARRLEGPTLAPEEWPGADLAGSYLRLLASYEESISESTRLPSDKAFYPRLKAGQCRDADACREGSWEPVVGESRLSTTLFHLLALQSFPAYGFNAGFPLRPTTDPGDLAYIARAERRREAARRQAESVRLVPGALRRGIQLVRDVRVKNPERIEQTIRAAFAPVQLTYVRYVPVLDIGDHLESNNDEEFGKFKPLTRLGGKRDLLTEEVVQGLQTRDGVAGCNGEWDFVVPGPADDLTTLGRTLIFTLPDGTLRADGTPHWTSYVVIGFPVLP